MKINRLTSKAAALATTALMTFGFSQANAGFAKDREPAPIVTLADFKLALAADKNVKTQDVSFKKQNLKIAATLYQPADLDQSKKQKAIVVVHPGGGIKEQTAGLYAYRLAQAGYVALTFDATYQGASEGIPRGLEDPSSRVEDVRSAVDYLTTISYVDKENIGALGICAGGGYTIKASMTDHRIKAVATVSAVDIGSGFREGWRQGNPISEQIKTLEAVAKQRTAEASGAEVIMGNYVPDTVEKVTEPDMVEASEYYRLPNRWLHANSTNRFVFTSIDKIFAYSSFDGIDKLLTQPLLMIAGSKAGSLWQSQRAINAARNQKELYIVKDGTHMSLYDRDVTKALPKLSEFFGKNLKIVASH